MSGLADVEMRVPVRSQLWESVLSSLRLAILTGSLASGTHLVESELASRLNVSRGPIREALTRLEQEGLVVNSPYRGKFVADITTDDVRDVYDLRRLLESRAIESVAGRLDNEELATLKRLSAQMAEALNEGYNEAFADLDVEFHRQLVMMSKRERLLQVWNMLSGVTHAFIVINTRNDPQTIRSIAEAHEQIINALTRHDVAAALAILKRHLGEAEDSVLGTKTGEMAADGQDIG